MPALTLDGVVFESFEIPEEIPIGGKQAGKLHKLPGGIRIFDAKGPDDENINWSGRFRSNSALGRALTLNSMRRDGSQRTLTVLGMSYTVVIDSFIFTVKKPYEVDYKISLLVLSDDTQGIDIISSVPTDLDSLVSGDLGAASNLFTGINSGVDAAFTALQGTITTAGTLANAPLGTLTPVSAAAAALSTAISTAISTTDATISSHPYGSDPFNTGAAHIAATLATLNQQAALLDGAAYAGRAIANLENDAG